MKPMLCQPTTIDQVARLSGDWIVEEKYDGVRAVIKDGKVFDRRGKDITKQFPEFEGVERVLDTFDGEIIAQTGEFNDVSGRVHLRDRFVISLASKKSPALFMAFDMPEVKGTLADRKQAMVGKVLPSWLKVSRFSRLEFFDDEWAKVLANGKEGLVIKRLDSKYEEKRSSDWLKLKAFKETTHVFTKVEEHPRGVTLEDDEGRRVVVNGSQANEVRAALKRDGKVTAEIQFLPQNGSDAWRFPSFRGLAKEEKDEE